MNESNFKIKNDQYFKNYIERRSLSKSTQTVYIGRIKSFCDFLGKNPSELIKEAKKSDKSRINEYFHDYIENLKKHGKTSSTIINTIDTVKSFYNEYDIDIGNINDILPKIEISTPKKIISKDQIKETLELSNLRDRAIILLHMSSGMEATELRHLTYDDFLHSIEDYIDLKHENKYNLNKIADKLLKIDEIVGTWTIEKNRTKKAYVTFNSPESTKAILNYLLDRQRKNKPIKSLKDPLFVNTQNEAINISAHGSIFKRINNRANFGYLTKKRRFFSSTMLRKYFKTKLLESGMDERTLDAILGHKLDSNIDYHSDVEIEVLKNKYIKALGNISLEKQANTDIITSEEYQKLVMKLKEKDRELKEIKKYLNHIKQIIE